MYPTLWFLIPSPPPPSLQHQGFWEAGGGREKGRPIEAAGEAEGHCGAGRDVGFWWEK